MAMINCWECGKDVSDAASSCPSCGAPRKGVVDAEIEAKKYTKIPWWAAVLGLGLLGFVAIVIKVQAEDPEKKSARSSFERCVELYEELKRKNDDAQYQLVGRCERERLDFIDKYKSPP